MRALGFELLDDIEQVADRPGEAIEADHDEGLAGSDFAQHARQYRPGTISAGGVLLAAASQPAARSSSSCGSVPCSSVETRA